MLKFELMNIITNKNYYKNSKKLQLKKSFIFILWILVNIIIMIFFITDK